MLTKPLRARCGANEQAARINAHHGAFRVMLSVT